MDEVLLQMGYTDPSTGTILVDSSSTFPTTDMITFYINNAESFIDRETWRSWRAKSTDGFEYYNVFTNLDGGGYGGGFGFGYGYTILNGIYTVAIKLIHSKLRDLVEATDFLEYFDGGDWIDIIANKISGDGFGEGDYWIDQEQGIVYLFTILPSIGRSTFRAKYRYGSETVPEDIREATAKRAAIDVLTSDWFKRNFPDNGAHLSMGDQISQYEKTIDRIIGNYKGIEFIY